VVNEHFLGETLQDPIVLQRFKRSHAIHRIPIQALVDEVQEFIILALFENVMERLGVGQAAPATRVSDDNRHETIFFKEQVAARAQFDYIIRGDTLDFHDIGELFSFVLSREERVASVKFCHDAAKRPHVDARRVRDSHHDLRRSVETRLNICVNTLPLEAAAAIVDNFDSGLVRLLQQNILRLQIAVDDVVIALELERLQDLDGEASDQSR